MRLFRIYVDGALFYHPHLSKLAVTKAEVKEDAENIDSLTLSAPYNHPYLAAIRHTASIIRENSLLIIIPPPIKLRS